MDSIPLRNINYIDIIYTFGRSTTQLLNSRSKCNYCKSHLISAYVNILVACGVFTLSTLVLDL